MAEKKTTDKIMEIAKSVSEAAEPYIEKAKEKAGPMLDEATKVGGDVFKEVKEKAKPATDAVMEMGKGLSEASAKKNVKTEFYIQYKDYEIRTEDIGEKIKEQYIAQGHKATEIKELQVYLKPEENTAYYVVNHQTTGKFTY